MGEPKPRELHRFLSVAFLFPQFEDSVFDRGRVRHKQREQPCPHNTPNLKATRVVQKHLRHDVVHRRLEVSHVHGVTSRRGDTAPPDVNHSEVTHDV